MGFRLELAARCYELQRRSLPRWWTGRVLQPLHTAAYEPKLVQTMVRWTHILLCTRHGRGARLQQSISRGRPQYERWTASYTGLCHLRGRYAYEGGSIQLHNRPFWRAGVYGADLDWWCIAFVGTSQASERFFRLPEGELYVGRPGMILSYDCITISFNAPRRLSEITSNRMGASWVTRASTQSNATTVSALLLSPHLALPSSS